MALGSGELTIIYSALIITALVVAVTLMLSLTLAPKVFIAIFSFYMCGCTAYLFAYLIMKKKVLDPNNNDIQFTIADYMTLFNMVLCLFIFVMVFVVYTVQKKKPDIPGMMYGPGRY